MNLQRNRAGGLAPDSCDAAQDLVTGSCEHDTEPVSSIKDGEFT
jgi:hypothetical protein